MAAGPADDAVLNFNDGDHRWAGRVLDFEKKLTQLGIERLS